MSTQRLLNITTGAVAVLLVGAAILSWNGGRGAVDDASLELAAGQTAALDELRRDAQDLATAADLADVNMARARLGASILRFDRTLSALINGGTVASLDGASVRVEPSGDQAVREALGLAVESWRSVGVPLADLAAGAFSAYSAAGQSALRGLEESHPALARQLDAVDAALQASATGRSGRTKSARALAVGLALLLAGLFVLRRFVAAPGKSDRTPATSPAVRPAETPIARPLAPAAARPAAPARPAAAPDLPLRPYTSPVDLEDVSLAVDRLAVDLNAIATNSDKMRTAIDSVGHALQGMLFSLKEMAKDTAEGERLVGGAHTAASYTRDVADALTASVREMSTVVASVSDLARRTRDTADRISTDAAHGERTGQGFTPAMSNEIRGLASHTGAATAQIEETVSSMLAVTREYEEAIGEILQHISAINKVSQDLGQVMLDPPAPAVVPAPSLAPAEDPLDEPVADELPDEDLADFTAAAIADAAEAQAEVAIEEVPEAVADDVAEVVEEPAAEEPVVEEAAEAAPEAVEEAPVVEESDTGTFSLDPEGTEPAAETEPADPHKVFMLSKPAQPETENELEAEAEPEPEPADEPAAVDDEVFEVPTQEFEVEPEEPTEPEAVVEAEPEVEVEAEAVVEAEPETESEPETVDSGNLSFFS